MKHANAERKRETVRLALTNQRYRSVRYKGRPRPTWGYGANMCSTDESSVSFATSAVIGRDCTYCRCRHRREVPIERTDATIERMQHMLHSIERRTSDDDVSMTMETQCNRARVISQWTTSTTKCMIHTRRRFGFSGLKES
jgi:hypothetical protein